MNLKKDGKRTVRVDNVENWIPALSPQPLEAQDQKRRLIIALTQDEQLALLTFPDQSSGFAVRVQYRLAKSNAESAATQPSDEPSKPAATPAREP